MKLSEELLEKLSDLTENERTVLSVYLPFDGDSKQGKKMVREKVKKIYPALDDEEREYLDVSLEEFEKYLDRVASQKDTPPGVAYFADLEQGFAEGVELPSNPDFLVSVDKVPILLPLIIQFDEFEPVGVIVADSSEAKIFITAGEIIETKTEFSVKIHHLSKVGGWSQMRYQRRRDKQVKEFAKDVANAAEKIFSAENIKRIFLAGRREILVEIERALPQKLRDAIVDFVPWDLDEPDRKLLDRLSPIITEFERNQERNLLKRFVAEIRRDGLAAAGLEDTRRALKNGQVEILLLSANLDPQTAENLVRQAERTSSYVEYFPPHTEILAQYGGVGAILRYKI